MNSGEIRQNFLDFFEKKGHKIVPSSSLIPSDPTVLFTTAGMQIFSPYLAGEKDVLKDFKTRHLASCQKCFRTNDIEKIGDDTHHTFFEMLGNWSIGEDKKTGYFKEGAIKYAWEFVIKKLKLDKDKIWITIFKGNRDIPKDEESKEIWMKLGVPEERIREFGEEDNLWGPVKDIGPCGPTSEIHYDRGEEFCCGDKNCGPNCPKCKRIIELWNLVFMEYKKEEDGSFKPLPYRNVDTGAGFERIVAVLQNKPSSYETDLFEPIIKEIEKISSINYSEKKEDFRVLADHIRASVFLISEGMVPSNLERGYILRRLLRRAICASKSLNLKEKSIILLAQEVINIYKGIYPELQSKQSEILTILDNEEEKFGKSLMIGIGVTGSTFNVGDITGEKAFDIYQTYGCPLETIEKIAKEKGKKIINKESFYEAQKKHQEISRAGAEKKFGGVGKEATYEATKLHTATHLLQAALRKVLGEEVHQMGSDITSERLRFDFSFNRKMAPEEIKKVQDIINQKIKENLIVKREEMEYGEAIESGALAFFKEKYPDKVSVYSTVSPSNTSGQVFSREICAGPHVKKTSELGKIKIIKEESSGAGIRRIRAILENRK